MHATCRVIILSGHETASLNHAGTQTPGIIMQVLIEFENKPLFFGSPIEVISCRKLSEITACFEKMETALGRSYYLAGFLSYEAGYGFEDRFRSSKTFDFPLVHMGVYESPDAAPPLPVGEGWPCPTGRRAKAGVRAKQILITKDKYFQNIQRIREYIAAGDVYQITYCVKFNFELEGDDFGLYRN